LAQGNDAARLKVATVVGTRPELIRLSRVLAVLDREMDHCLIHTGQNYDYELNEIFFEQLGIRKPDHFLGAAGKTAAVTIGQIMASVDEVFETERPDAMLVLGDTNSCMSAYVAKRRKIPVFHMEAGNRCFDQRVPEEINRRVVDHISDINLTYSERSRQYLLREGAPPEMVIKTGSPMKEVLTHYMPDIEKSNALDRLGVKPGEYFLVSAHREENIDSEKNFNDLLDSLNAIAAKYNKPVIVSTHPRTRKRLEERGVETDQLIRFLKPMGFLDYVKLQMSAACVVSDSGTVTEESSILNIPAVMIRQAHERPEGQDEGSVIMCGLGPERTLEAIDVTMATHGGGERRFKIVPDYDVDNVSDKVLRIILGYTDYIRRVVWSEYR